MFKKQIISILLATSFFVPNVPAQNKDNENVQQTHSRSTGLSIAYGSSSDIAIRTKISSTIYLRPTISISFSKSLYESDNPTSIYTDESSSITISPGIDAIFSLSVNELLDNFNTYVGCGPRFSYREINNEYKYTQATPNISTNITRGYGGVAFFGTEYWLNDRFSLLGEVGLSYNHTYNSSYGSHHSFKTDEVSSFIKVGINFMF